MYVCMMPTVACASFFGMHGMLIVRNVNYCTTKLPRAGEALLEFIWFRLWLRLSIHVTQTYLS